MVTQLLLYFLQDDKTYLIKLDIEECHIYYIVEMLGFLDVATIGTEPLVVTFDAAEGPWS